MRWLLAVILAALVFAGCVQMSAEEIAKKMQEKEEKIQDMRAEVYAVTESPFGRMEMNYTYIFKKPYKLYMEDENSITVTNGSVMWSYDKKNNRVMVFEMNRSAESTPVKFDYTTLIREMLDYYDVELLGEDKVSGRDCFVLNLKPKNEAENATKMWVDKEFWFPIRMETSFGDFSMQIEYRNLSFNTGVDDSFFEFKPPEGAQVEKFDINLPKTYESVEEAQKEVGFKILVPSYTAGYELKSVSVTNDSAYLTYSDGEKVMTIFESTEKSDVPKDFEEVEINGEKAFYGEIFGVSVLYIEKNGIQVSVSGELTKEELIKIAGSLG